MKMELSKSFVKKLENRIGRYEFEVGVLEDKSHYMAQEAALFGDSPTRDYAGGPVRKATRQESGKTVGEVLVDNMERLNINLLSRPFQDQSSEIMKFTRAFLQMATGGKISLKRVENLLQAVVRNPILKQEYGSNSSFTADNKGFDRHLFDTGQMFKAIKARARRV